jgi:hypothetical protein
MRAPADVAYPGLDLRCTHADDIAGQVGGGFGAAIRQGKLNHSDNSDQVIGLHHVAMAVGNAGGAGRSGCASATDVSTSNWLWYPEAGRRHCFWLEPFQYTTGCDLDNRLG